jgi:hypothetical protein
MQLWLATNNRAFLREVYHAFQAGNPLYTTITVVVLIGILLFMTLAMVRANRKRYEYSTRAPSFKGRVTITGIGPEFARPLHVNKDATVEVAVMKPVTCLTESEVTLRIDLPYEHWELMKRGKSGILEAKGSRFVSFTPTTVQEVNT